MGEPSSNSDSDGDEDVDVQVAVNSRGIGQAFPTAGDESLTQMKYSPHSFRGNRAWSNWTPHHQHSSFPSLAKGQKNSDTDTCRSPDWTNSMSVSKSSLGLKRMPFSTWSETRLRSAGFSTYSRWATVCRPVARRHRLLFMLSSNQSLSATSTSQAHLKTCNKSRGRQWYLLDDRKCRYVWCTQAEETARSNLHHVAEFQHHEDLHRLVVTILSCARHKATSFKSSRVFVFVLGA